jgi:predicted RNase H-like HicB family nuclease
MKYTVLLEKGPKSWGATVPDLPGCVAVADTQQEVLSLISEAIELHIAALKDEGVDIPPPVSVASYVEVSA